MTIPLPAADAPRKRHMCAIAAGRFCESQEQLAEAQRMANVGSWEVDFTTGLRAYSDQFCRIFGVDPDEQDATPDVERLQAMEKSARETLQPVAEQHRLVLPDGSTRTVVSRIHVVFNDAHAPQRLVGVVQDITERVAHEEELRRVAVQQAAVANLGQLALSGASLDFLFTQITTLLRNILGVDICHILQKRSGGELALVAGSQPSPHTIVSGLTVMIASVDERPWGTLSVHTSERRTFSPTDGDFLRSVAAVLAQAIERNRADAELRARALQQSAIAELGRAALTKVDGETIERACALAARGLGMEEVEFVPRHDGRGPEPRIPVSSSAQTFGALVVHVERDLTDDEVNYVQSIANILAEAMDREQTHAARQQLTRSLQLLLESTLEGISTIDAEGRCTMVNAAAARMFGRTAEEMLGVEMHELVHGRRADGSPYPRSECPISHVLRDATPQAGISEVFWHAEGTPFPVEYSAAPIVDGDAVVGVVVIFADITERRKLELKLEQATRLSNLGRLAATVAHEFNNVLMGISPFVEVIRRKPERTAMALGQIAGAIGRGKRITEEILRFTRPAELVRKDFAVEPWLRDLTADVDAVLPPSLRVVVDVIDPLLRVHADRNQLHSVLTNLIVNARDAMPDGGTVAISARREAAFAHLTVRDSGCGMSEETLRHIFEPLFTTKGSGTGLGLAVAHQVVERHGGEIFAESTAGAGTTFHLLIPIATSEEESAAPIAAPPPPKSSRVRRLLLVDDDEAVVAGLAALLEMEGIEVDAVGSGAAAIDYLRHATPHVVLLDV
ncbi:MAG TPA: ATP-binding protein, partial [Thermoanaerobaculia bacterium]|nr:ATP-binding protein [Thermoanaerobaculia bacterium]